MRMGFDLGKKLLSSKNSLLNSEKSHSKFQDIKNNLRIKDLVPITAVMSYKRCKP